MDKSEDAATARRIPVHTTSSAHKKRWRDMNVFEKLLFLGKLVFFICTGGFAFANLFE